MTKKLFSFCSLILFLSCPQTVTDQPASPTKYSITYISSGQDSGETPIDSASYEAGKQLRISDAGTMVKNGTTLVSWNTQINGLGVDYLPNQTIVMPIGGLILYAQWLINELVPVSFRSMSLLSGGPFPAEDRFTNTVSPFLAGLR